MTIRLRALRHRNFRLFVSGQMCALVGYWIQQLALSWLVYRMTGSATLLGVLAFAANLPVLLLAPVAGLWSDRFDRHRMMLATQVVEMAQAVALAALALGGVLEIWHVIALTVLLGVCVAIELPVRHAYLLELIGDKQDLPNAVAVMSLVANCGRLAGPVLAGLLIGWFSAATCFAINAVTYVAVLLSFAFIRVEREPPAQSHQPFVRGLREGLLYAWRALPIRLLLLVLAVIGLTATPYATLMPALVSEVFAGGAETLGFMVGAAGVGAVAGTLILASRPGVRGLLSLIIAASFIAGAALAALSWSRLLPLSLVLMALIGFGILVISVSVNMILQAIVDDDKRGRVMSLYTMAFLGVSPLGSLLAGVLADRIGAANTVLAGGIACLLAAVYLLRRLPLMRAHIRPIYARLGIAE